MLVNFILNSMDTFNIFYFWTVLSKKNNNIIKLILGVITISVLITIADQLQLNFMFTYVIDVIIIKILYKKDLKNVIFGLLVTLLIVMFLQLILSLIINKFIYNFEIQGIIVQAIISVGVVVFSKSNLFEKKITFGKIDNAILTCFILTCSIYVIVLKFVWDYDNSVIENNLFIVSIILILLITSQIFIYIYVAKVIKETEILKVSNEYNSVINEIVQEIKQRQHDFINYRNTIRGIVEVTNDKEVKSAISNYMQDEDLYDSKINELIYVDNVVIRSVVYRSICKAKKYNVNFEYKIENNVLDDILTYHQISNLLNNLLNNAFEEVMKSECDKKDIKIKILKRDKQSHLIVKNQIVSSNDVNLNEMFKRGYSDKSTGTRGYGLYNVQQIVNLHKGCVKINIEYGEIIFDIYFNNSSG